jgi:hypothetical protein
MESSGQDWWRLDKVKCPADFTKSNAPVVNDISFRIILIEMMVWNLNDNFIDIEASDMKVGNFKYLVFKKTIYELTQSVRKILM